MMASNRSAEELVTKGEFAKELAKAVQQKFNVRQPEDDYIDPSPSSEPTAKSETSAKESLPNFEGICGLLGQTSAASENHENDDSSDESGYDIVPEPDSKQDPDGYFMIPDPPPIPPREPLLSKALSEKDEVHDDNQMCSSGTAADLALIWSPDIASLKEKCLEAFGKIWSEHSLLEGIRDYFRDPQESLIEIYKITDNLASWIHEKKEPKYRPFHGSLRGIGSHHDKTTVGPTRDVDFLYVLDWKDFEVDLADESSLCYNIIPGDNESEMFADMIEDSQGKPKLLCNKVSMGFAECVNHALTSIELPSNMTHAGFCSPAFAGVRESGPAVSISFHYQRSTDKVMIKIDITPALPISFAKVPAVPNRSWPEPLCQLIRNSRSPPVAHLIPTDRNRLWKLTTASLENGAMQKLSDNGKVRRTIQTLKAMQEKYLAIRFQSSPEKEDCNKKMEELVQKCLAEQAIVQKAEEFWKKKKMGKLLLYHRACKLLPTEEGEYRNQLETSEVKHIENLIRNGMLKDWSAVHPGILALTGEMCPPGIAVTSCASKYPVLDFYYNETIDDADNSAPDVELIERLLRESMKSKIRHTFLGTDIATKKISPYAMTQSQEWRDSLINAQDAICNSFLDKIKPLKETMEQIDTGLPYHAYGGQGYSTIKVEENPSIGYHADKLPNIAYGYSYIDQPPPPGPQYRPDKRANDETQVAGYTPLNSGQVLQGAPVTRRPPESAHVPPSRHHTQASSQSYRESSVQRSENDPVQNRLSAYSQPGEEQVVAQHHSVLRRHHSNPPQSEQRPPSRGMQRRTRSSQLQNIPAGRPISVFESIRHAPPPSSRRQHYPNVQGSSFESHK